MLDPVLAHVDLVHRDDVFREIVPYEVVDAKLPCNRILSGKQIGDLNIELLPAPVTDKINFPVSKSADGDRVAAPEKLHVDDVFQDQER